MAARGGAKEDGVADRPYDEAIPIETDDDDDVSTPPSSQDSSPASSPSAARAQQHSEPRSAPPPGPLAAVSAGPAAGGGKRRDDDEGSESAETSSSEGSSEADSSVDGEDEKKSKSSLPSGAYNPDDFKGMKVSSEIEELFQQITRYTPHTIELDTALKPFIPELIPSIGEVDAFLKMARPDAEVSELGTVRLDEPTLNPSDPSILDLQLRSITKAQDLTPMEVRSIENAEKNPKEIETWVKRIDELNRSKPAPTVQYSRRMPDIEQLMQVWMAEFEEYLQHNPLPEFSDLPIDLPSLIKIMASILDVPVNGQMTETLHVIFTLYSEFKTNQHFSKTDTMGGMGHDQYNFGPAPNFAASGPIGAGGPGGTFGGGQMESMAPSRAPSPDNSGRPRPGL
jgi:intraflagellar transport protein 46